MVSSQIYLKDYSFYSFHLILIKLGIYDHWEEVCLDKKFYPRGPGGALKEVNLVQKNIYFNNVIHVSALRPMGLLLKRRHLF